jgi:hypothetical protein
LKQYGRGETPEGRFLAVTIGEQTVRLESRKADYLRIQGIRRGVWLVVSYDATKHPNVLYVSDVASKARAAFQAARLELTALTARGFLKRAYLSKANRYRKIAAMEPVNTRR